jgi:hypothetical protein
MRMIDHFAENLSQHGDVVKAAAQLGKSRGWGHAALRKLRKALGEQAR